MENFDDLKAQKDAIVARENEKLFRIEREACAVLCETLPLKMEPGIFDSTTERYIVEVTEAGCRLAFAKAIRGRISNI
jgi:hypothetical protein